MNLIRSSLVASLVAVAGLAAVPVTPVHAAAANDLGGKPVPGVCFLSREAMFAQSKVGQAASARLQQLAEQSRTQLANQRKPLDTDIQNFEKAAPKLSEDQRKSQGAALQQRMQTFQAQAGQLGQRIQATRAKAMQQIGEQAEPVVSSVYKSHQCGLLLNRDAVLAGNMENDLTADVVKGLDGRMSTISFNLEPLPASKTN